MADNQKDEKEQLLKRSNHIDIHTKIIIAFFLGLFLQAH